MPVATTGETRLARATPLTRRRLLQTLLFLPAVGLRRPCELRGYTADSLALLTGRCRAYGYRSVERFLAEVAAQGGDAAITDALARWTTSLWAGFMQGDGGASFYIDSHRKAVFSDRLIPVLAKNVVRARNALLAPSAYEPLRRHNGAAVVTRTLAIASAPSYLPLAGKNAARRRCQAQPASRFSQRAARKRGRPRSLTQSPAQSPT